MANKTKKLRRAFTLYELVVVIALFALVGGMVTSFIVFMGNYSRTSERQSQRVSELTQLLGELDTWFSFADSSQSALEFPEQGDVLVRAGDMSLSSTRGEGQSEFTFDYGGERTQTLTFENEYILHFYTEGQVSVSGENVLIRFTLSMRVQGGAYACEVSYV